MFKEKEDATHIRAAEVMREFGWDATSYGTLLQSMLQMEWIATYWDGMPHIEFKFGMQLQSMGRALPKRTLGMHPDAAVASKTKYFNAVVDDGEIDFCTSDILPPKLCQRS